MPLQRWQDHRAGHAGGPIGQKQATGVCNGLQPVGVHGEQADLVSRAEPMLDDPQHS